VAAWVHDMFFNFCLVKNIWLTNKWTTTETREKLSTYLESLKFKKCFWCVFDKFKNNQILPHKISHQFQVTAKLFSGWKFPLQLLHHQCLSPCSTR
jgi:hypothetical protein